MTISPPTTNSPHFQVLDTTTLSGYAILDMQLGQYFKKSASGIILPMLFGFLPLTLCNGTRAAIAFSVFAVLSVVLTIVPLLFAGKIQQQHGDDTTNDDVDAPDRRRIELLCFAAYASNISLMITAACLAAVINKWYWALASPLLLIVAMLFSIFLYYGLPNKLDWGTQQYYDKHKDDLKFFFDLSSDVTQTAFAGLSGSLLGNLKKARCLQDTSFGTAEGFTLYAVIVGLFLMFVCTIPPAIEFPSKRDMAVTVFLKWTAYLTLALVSIAGLFAAATVVQTFVVFAVVLIGAMGAFWFYKVYSSKPRSGNDANPHRMPDATRARHAAGERSLLWLGIHTLMFGTLMASYSVFLSGQHFSGLYKAGVFFVFAVLLTNFCRMILVLEVRNKESEASVVLVTGLAIIFLVLVAVLLLVTLTMLHPNELRNTFSVA
ncbi:unnamed protein product [Urochloa decumbens]|uniref:Uncharacterized protein n=1 Tax=Urochloa decumbens TaxID=240449 RepID=A0ABC9BU08_9POAL